MALRIEASVIRGEIDNRERSWVRGRIWIYDRGQPITLELAGNCLSDLAGRLTRFSRPQTVTSIPEKIQLDLRQSGVAGDLTASRKVRVFDLPLEEAIEISKKGGAAPEHLANALYLEWFSEANGRVVIESTEFQVEVSLPAWEMTPEEEKAQIQLTHQALRDWLERLDFTAESESEFSFDAADETPLDEFGHEKLMRESDARTERYMELLEKYEGHPDQQKIVAREMGWEWLDEALEADERGALLPREKMEVPPREPNPASEGVDWIRSADGDVHHPLTKRAFESAMAAWHFCEDRGLLGENGDNDLHEMISQFQIAGAKVAGALDGLAYDDDLRDGAFIVAALKRALNYLHQSMKAAEKVGSKKILPPERVECFRADLFSVREEILALMQRFREKRA